MKKLSDIIDNELNSLEDQLKTMTAKDRTAFLIRMMEYREKNKNAFDLFHTFSDDKEI